MMQKTIYRALTSLAIAVALSAVISGCGEEEMKSAWLDRQAVTGGLADDPQQSSVRHFIAKGEAVIDIFNDEKTLVVQISTRNQNLHKQLTMAGLMVWFDETGGKNKRYGLRLPSGGPSPSQGQSQRGNRVPRRDVAERDAPFDGQDRSNTGNIEITGPGENEFSRISVKDSNQYGIQYRTEGSGGYFVHELRMPLIRGAATPYGIAQQMPTMIGICLEPPQKDNSRVDTGITVGGGGRGGRGPQGGGTGGPPGGRGRGDMGQGTQEAPLNLWLKVHLAVKPVINKY